MENNGYDFGFEPMDEQAQQYQTSTPPHREPTYSPYQQPEKPKKNQTARIVVLVAIVALLGSVGGALLTNAISGLGGRPEQAQQVVQEAPQDGYELVEHTLPEKLATNNTGKTLTASQVYELTVNSVVGIQTEATTNIFGQEAVSASAGSGFILSEDGYIITNAHVISGADKITVDLFNGDSFPAELVGADTSFDVAVLKIDAKGLPAVSVGDSDTLKVGEDVIAIGNPLGELTFTMTNGILSALDREINTDGNPQNMLQTNAAINSGNSGGPLFDMDGNVIGVTTAKYSGTTTSGTNIEGLGFAIPINDALKVAYDLAEYGYVKGQAYLGVTIATLESSTASYYGLPVGPRVETVNPGSCAEKGGLQVGDVIVACDGEKVENTSAMLSMLKRRQAGDTIVLTVFRMGAEMDVTIVLDEKPSQQEIDAAAEAAAQQQQQEQQQNRNAQGEYYYQFPYGFDFFN
ncbi:MAG: trypsin-like peptidase domain-containing protein [Oscillospiraceae bacterium]|nr:trypsin-like peptidase domain-containing protein [Oscillospiraceae bacterium]